MGWKAEHRRIYEERVLEEALTKLWSVVDRKSVPLSDEELRTLARRARQHFRTRNRERLEKYKDHLAKSYVAEAVAAIASKLEDINN